MFRSVEKNRHLYKAFNCNRTLLSFIDFQCTTTGRNRQNKTHFVKLLRISFPRKFSLFSEFINENDTFRIILLIKYEIKISKVGVVCIDFDKINTF